ncbi:MAG: 4Fe-4S binding protein [Ruminococcus sp.]|nr:4Fe-4S binding protein [Ruminococcus sp.]
MAVDYAALKKGGFMRQKQKNNFSLRLRVVGGNVTAKQIAKVAEVAQKYGEGYVHLTSRQSIEIPFIKLDDIDEVKAALAEGGVEPGVCGPRVRTVTACQGSEICPSGCIDTYAIAKELDERYYARELPHKFKFGITGCQNNCLKAEENDLGIKGGIKVAWRESDCIHCGVCLKACRTKALTEQDGKIVLEPEKCNFCGRCVKSCPTESWDCTHGYIVSFGGIFGNQISKGEAIIPFIEDHDKLMAVCDAAIGFFKDNANPSERFKFTIDRVGYEQFEKAIKNAYYGEKEGE